VRRVPGGVRVSEPIVLLHDEVADHMATYPRGKAPRWRIVTADVVRGYSVVVEIGGEVAVSAFGRSLADAHRRAWLDLQKWRSQTEGALVAALEASIEKRAAGE